MTSLPASHVSSRPFTYLLAYVLCALAVAFLITNFVFISRCIPEGRAATLAPSCTMPRAASILDSVLPAIWRPISAFQRAGNFAQEAIVRNSLQFIWGTAICTVGIMIFVCLFWIRLQSDDQKRRARTLISDRIRFLDSGGRHVMTTMPRLFSYIGLMFLGILLVGDPGLMKGTLSGHENAFYGIASSLFVVLLAFVSASILSIRAWLLRTAVREQGQ